MWLTYMNVFDFEFIIAFLKSVGMQHVELLANPISPFSCFLILYPRKCDHASCHYFE